MSDRTERIILARLLATCKDAERGFLAAAEEATTPELKRLLFRLAEQRQEFAADLLPHMQRLGGDGESAGTTIAALHRAWIHLKAHLATDAERAVIQETARGERIASTVYDAALQQLPSSDTHKLIESHELGIRVANRLVSNMLRR